MMCRVCRQGQLRFDNVRVLAKRKTLWKSSTKCTLRPEDFARELEQADDPEAFNAHTHRLHLCILRSDLHTADVRTDSSSKSANGGR